MQYIPQKGTIRFGNISFSEKEIKDIIKAWLAISIAFAFLLGDSFLVTFFISALTVGVGFIFHELGHKVVAQKYGAWAEFRAWDQMLIMAILLAFFFRIVFAAPGAVMISGRTIGKSRYGKIAAAGPIMSYVTAVIFLAIMIIFPVGIVHAIGNYGFMINTWLGLFNMIPFGMLDGKKIITWNKGVYGILVGVGVFLMIIQYVL